MDADVVAPSEGQDIYELLFNTPDSRKVGRSATVCFFFHWRVCFFAAITLFARIQTGNIRVALTSQLWGVRFISKRKNICVMMVLYYVSTVCGQTCTSEHTPHLFMHNLTRQRVSWTGWLYKSNPGPLHCHGLSILLMTVRNIFRIANLYFWM